MIEKSAFSQWDLFSLKTHFWGKLYVNIRYWGRSMKNWHLSKTNLLDVPVAKCAILSTGSGNWRTPAYFILDIYLPLVKVSLIDIYILVDEPARILNPTIPTLSPTHCGRAWRHWRRSQWPLRMFSGLHLGTIEVFLWSFNEALLSRVDSTWRPFGLGLLFPPPSWSYLSSLQAAKDFNKVPKSIFKRSRCSSALNGHCKVGWWFCRNEWQNGAQSIVDSKSVHAFSKDNASATWSLVATAIIRVLGVFLDVIDKYEVDLDSLFPTPPSGLSKNIFKWGPTFIRTLSKLAMVPSYWIIPLFAAILSAMSHEIPTWRRVTFFFSY